MPYKQMSADRFLDRNALRGASGLYGGYLFEAPRDLGRADGIGPLLVSTALIVTLALALAISLSLPTAILYCELPGPRWRKAPLPSMR